MKSFVLGIYFDSTSTCNKLFSKKLLINNRFDENIKIGEDLLFNYYCLKSANRLAVTDKVLYNYIFHNKSAMRTANADVISRYKNIKKSFCQRKKILKTITHVCINTRASSFAV